MAKSRQASSPKPQVDSRLKDQTVFPNGPVSAESSGSFQFPTTECKKYQQWFEHSQESESSVHRLMYAFKHQYDSPLYSSIILLGVAIVSIGLVLLLWYFFPLTATINKPAKSWLQAYRDVPQEEIGYVLENAFPVHLNNPRCFCTDSHDRFYVGGDQTVVLFSETGSAISSFSLKQNPNCLSVPEQGEVYEGCLIVGFPNSFELYRRKEDGGFAAEPLFLWDVPGEKSCLRKIITSHNTLYVADAGEKHVYALNPDGEILWTLGRPFANGRFPVPREDDSPLEFPGFVIPNLPYLDLAVVPNSQMIAVTNPGKHRIELFTREGIWQPKLSWGTPGVGLENFCGCCNPVGLASLPNGDWVTVEKYLSRVKVYDSKGNFKTMVATPEELENPPDFVNGVRNNGEYIPPLGAESPFQIAVLSDGRIAVLDPTYRMIRLYAPKNQRAKL